MWIESHRAKKSHRFSRQRSPVHLRKRFLQGPAVHLFGDIRKIQLVGELIERDDPGSIAQGRSANHGSDLQRDLLIKSGDFEDGSTGLRIGMDLDHFAGSLNYIIERIGCDAPTILLSGAFRVSSNFGE